MTTNIYVPFTKVEAALIAAAAKRAGLTVEEWAKQVLLDAAREVLERAKAK